ncbi:MAG: hypothetical protein VB091_00215 [Christensenella sp.]|nr:hypothetical protein [Christensenella sp.]
MTTWDTMYNSFKENPRNVQTHPLRNNSIPMWFYAYSDGSAICIEVSRGEQPSCSIKNRRKLEHDKFDKVFDIYLRREKGESVTEEISLLTRQASYWFGVIYALEHGN